MVKACVRATFLAAAFGAAIPARADAQGAAPTLVDFRAVTEAGDPVLDLKAEEVTLRVGGRPRAIRSLELIKVGADTGPVRVSPLPPPFVANTGTAASGGSREIILILDEDSIAPGREASVRESTSNLLAALHPSDRVALVSTRQGGVSVPFTRDHTAIRGAISAFSGHSSPRESSSDFVCRTVVALQSVRAAVGAFSTDALKTLVFISAALSAPQDDTARVGSSSALCQLRTRDFEDLGNEIQNSRAHFYVAHILEASASPQSPQTLQAGIDSLAGVAGGETIRITGASESALPRIARETSAYYLAAFDPEPADRTGMRQRVELRVSRDRVRVAARPNIVIAKAAGAAAAGKPVTPRDMVSTLSSFRDLPLRAAAFPSRQPNGKPQTLVLFEPVEPGTKITATTIVLFDAKNSAKDQWNGRPEDFATSPVMALLLRAEPGTYRMRIAAVDAANRAGTIDLQIDVNLPGVGAVKTSGLLIGVPAPSGPLMPRLQFTAADTQAIVYLEIYNVPKGSKPAVTLELAETLDGPPAMSGALPLADGPTEDSRIARAGLNISSLPAGDVVVRTIVSVDGKEIARLVRTLRKTK